MTLISAEDVTQLPLWDKHGDNPPWTDTRPVWGWLSRATTIPQALQLLYFLDDGDRIAARFAAECVVRVGNKLPPSGSEKLPPKSVLFRKEAFLATMAGKWGVDEQLWQWKRLEEMVREACDIPH